MARIRSLLILLATVAVCASGWGQIVTAPKRPSENVWPEQSDRPTPALPLTLSCSSPPCVLPNVQVTSDWTLSPLLATSPAANPTLAGTAFDSTTCGGTLGSASTDGGSQWTGQCLRYIASTGDPVVAYGNKALYAGGAVDPTGEYIEYSTDGGSVWSKEIEVTAPLFPSGVANIAGLAVDNGKKSPHVNNVYMSATQFDYQVVRSQISVSTSHDNGNIWSTVTVDPIQYKPVVEQFSRMAVGNDGTIYVAWQRCTMTSPQINCAGTQAQMLLSKSIDGGKTWSNPIVIATLTLVPDTCDCSQAFFGNLPNTNEGVSNIPLLAIDNNAASKYIGNLYVSLYNYTGEQMQVEVATSTDGGTTWGTPVVVAQATHDQFFPAIAVSSNGTLGVGWLDRRNDPLNIEYQPFAAISSDGGASFGTNYELATNLSDPYLDGQSGDFMGDFIGATWSGSKTFLVTWPDTRSMDFMQQYVGGIEIK
jgi:hypothetical protein